MADESYTNLPEPIFDHFIPTLNNTGVMSTYLDEYCQEFIDFAAQQTAPVLEVGAAYGVVSIAALEAGASVIANDIDAQHLEFLRQHTPEECRSRLRTMQASFPDELELEPNSLSGAILGRLLNWLSGPEIQRGLDKLYSWLQPGGKITILAIPPFIGIYEKLLPDYEARVAAGDEWPGYFTNMKKYIAPDIVEYVPATQHLFDTTVIARELLRAGFHIDVNEYYHRIEIAEQEKLDRREGLVAIATK